MRGATRRLGRLARDSRLLNRVMLQKLLSSKLQAAGLAVWLACALVIAFGARGAPARPRARRARSSRRIFGCRSRDPRCRCGSSNHDKSITRLQPVARKIRVVIAKPGLDGHDRGAKIIARALRDAGMEVIYTGLHQTPEQIAATVIQEDADAVGISILSGAHMTLVPRILEGLKDNGAEDVLVVVGGTIPKEDSEELKQRGVAEVFTPGAPTSEIVEFLLESVPA